MFTGIVEEIGKIETITDNRVVVSCQKVLEKTKIGDSIAVNGVCLTVTRLVNNSFEADVSKETFGVSALKYLKKNSKVNLERAIAAGERFGGHIVSGHIDGVGVVEKLNQAGEFYQLGIKLGDEDSKYVIRKGSIAINGISLTIARVEGNSVEIAVIPHTYEKTSLQELKIGDFVNVETDIFAKYVEKFLSTSDNRSRISVDFLQRNGFC